MLPITGRAICFTVLSRDVHFCNQRSREYTHPYEYLPGSGATLSNSGCGVFSVCHAGNWFTGKTFSPEELADFSRARGGRVDDGTDRPTLLAAMQETGLAAEFGFRYVKTEHQNDIELLWKEINAGNGALCNLRNGHIVFLAAARTVGDAKEYLAIDSYSESARDFLLDRVRGVVPGSEIISNVRNKHGEVVGQLLSYGAFWVDAGVPMDFDILERIV